MAAPEGLRLTRREVSHLDVVGQHRNVELHKLTREHHDIGVFRRVGEQVGNVGVGVAAVPVAGACTTGHRADGRKRRRTETCRISHGHLEVLSAPLRDRLHDLAQATGRTGNGYPSRPCFVLAEGTVAPDVLRQRTHMVDVLEALADSFVPEPLADRLRGVPAVDEQGAGRAEGAVAWRVIAAHSEGESGRKAWVQWPSTRRNRQARTRPPIGRAHSRGSAPGAEPSTVESGSNRSPTTGAAIPALSTIEGPSTLLVV